MLLSCQGQLLMNYIILRENQGAHSLELILEDP